MNKSSLFDEKTFYEKFTHDLFLAKHEIVIESPYITTERMKLLYPIFKRLIQRNIRIVIITRDPREHDESLEIQSESEIQRVFCLEGLMHIL